MPSSKLTNVGSALEKLGLRSLHPSSGMLLPSTVRIGLVPGVLCRSLHILSVAFSVCDNRLTKWKDSFLITVRGFSPSSIIFCKVKKQNRNPQLVGKSLVEETSQLLWSKDTHLRYDMQYN